MSIQVTTEPGALVALALDGDKEFLSLLDVDHVDILQRRGLVDVQKFNKRWSKHIQLLANNEPLRLGEQDINEVLRDTNSLLRDLPLFTIVMTCVVAALDQFAKGPLVQRILFNVLQVMLKPNENGEDVLRSQYNNRLSAWRSTACLRTLNQAAEKHRQELISTGSIIGGSLPSMESNHVEEFLIWLLSSNDPHFKTSSSDVAGIADCLILLGVDVLRVAEVDSESETDHDQEVCTVFYSSEPFLHGSTSKRSKQLMSRDVSMTVPLQRPWEAVSIFPISEDAKNESRLAWKEGKRRPRWHVRQTLFRSAPPQPLRNIVYAMVNRGRGTERANEEIYDLARTCGFFINGELLDGLTGTLHSAPPDILEWLIRVCDPEAEAREPSPPGLNINDVSMEDQNKVEWFCVFQSFFMGYYYEIFGKLIDTSTLASQTVEGSWGFRSASYFHYMRSSSFMKNPPENSRKVKTFGRSSLFPILSTLFLGGHAMNLELQKAEARLIGIECLGMIDKRSLFVNSLLGKFASPQQVGGFTLLDVDVGGVPRDVHGLVKPGDPTEIPDYDCLEQDPTHSISDNIQEKSPDGDFTMNIEADWAGDPDTALLCVRYKGRRVTSLSPIPSDVLFCHAFVQPNHTSSHLPSPPRSKLERGSRCK
uniref:Uncharacterized protein n=1 Tax=Bionectria ochroleuca TaxID=29856 RepID=A0A8H7TR34_BIOOC